MHALASNGLPCPSIWIRHASNVRSSRSRYILPGAGAGVGIVLRSRSSHIFVRLRIPGFSTFHYNSVDFWK